MESKAFIGAAIVLGLGLGCQQALASPQEGISTAPAAKVSMSIDSARNILSGSTSNDGSILQVVRHAQHVAMNDGGLSLED